MSILLAGLLFVISFIVFFVVKSIPTKEWAQGSLEACRNENIEANMDTVLASIKFIRGLVYFGCFLVLSLAVYLVV